VPARSAYIINVGEYPIVPVSGCRNEDVQGQSSPGARPLRFAICPHSASYNGRNDQLPRLSLFQGHYVKDICVFQLT